MKIITTLPMKRLDATGAQYLHATVKESIPAGAVVVLRKRSDGQFEIVIVVQPSDESDTGRLASFLDPKLVDAIRDESIASVVIHHKLTRSRKPRKVTPA